MTNPPPRNRTAPRRRIVRRPALFAMTLLIACGGAGAASDTMERETFIQTYVDLRSTAILGEVGELTDEERTEVLERHSVTEQDLFTFVEVHGTDLEFMRSVWDEVELQLDSQRERTEDRR